MERVDDDERTEQDIETVRDWLIRTYGREYEGAAAGDEDR